MREFERIRVVKQFFSISSYIFKLILSRLTGDASLERQTFKLNISMNIWYFFNSQKHVWLQWCSCSLNSREFSFFRKFSRIFAKIREFTSRIRANSQIFARILDFFANFYEFTRFRIFQKFVIFWPFFAFLKLF